MKKLTNIHSIQGGGRCKYMDLQGRMWYVCDGAPYYYDV